MRPPSRCETCTKPPTRTTRPGRTREARVASPITAPAPRRRPSRTPARRRRRAQVPARHPRRRLMPPDVAWPVRRGIVDDMASRTGAVATAPRHAVRLVRQPLSTLAHSAIASARAMNDDDDTAGDAVDGLGDAAELENRLVGSSVASSPSISTSTSSSSSSSPPPLLDARAGCRRRCSSRRPRRRRPFSAPSPRPPPTSPATSSSSPFVRAGGRVRHSAREAHQPRLHRAPPPSEAHDARVQDVREHERRRQLPRDRVRAHGDQRGMSIIRYADTSRRYGNGSTATPCCE